MKVMIVSVGTPKMPGLAEAIQDYEARAGHYFRFETLDVRSERITRGSDEGRIVQKESDALLEAVPAGFKTVMRQESDSGGNHAIAILRHGILPQSPPWEFKT